MYRGGSLNHVDIGYETWGELNASRDNGVLLFTGLSPSAHAASSAEDPDPGWWEGMVGPRKALDTDRFYVICVNSLGSCFGSTGPASHVPGSDRPYRLGFPFLSIEDIACGARAVLRALNIDQLYTVVGASMGGMTALAFNLLYPEMSRGLISISAAASATPFAIALRSLQREIIRSDPDWRDGAYATGSGPIRGMRLARKLGMISYRSAVEWQSRFDRQRVAPDRRDKSTFGIEFEVESYLDAQARKFIGQFDANCYLYLSRSMDHFDVADHGGTVAAGLGKVRCQRALIIGVTTDTLFPVAQQRELAAGLDGNGRRVEFVELPSVQGHDSFLVDIERFAPVVASFFQ